MSAERLRSLLSLHEGRVPHAYQDSLGWALYRLNCLEAAEEAVRRALERDGDNAVVLDHMCDILARPDHQAVG